ncbi:TPA: ImmA/IrrE family metallo-endopeptidase [Bacillus anthracis]|nr:ImmA/IrrE family metallo-endopeptidase [Bacillus anthracis]
MKEIIREHKFSGKKLKLARNIRGFTLEDLSQKINVTHQMLSKYEGEKSIPKPETIEKLAHYLGFETSFFFGRDDMLNQPDSPHFFRSGATVAKKYKDQVENKIELVTWLVKVIEEKIKLPLVSFPIHTHGESFVPTDFEQIDEIAMGFRKFLSLGDGPISNVTLLCEKLGIIIAYAPLEHEKIDACSVIYNNRPYIILNKDRISSVRLRFNIAHELGHLILHSRYKKKDVNDKAQHKRMEQEANRFASAFLMPETSFVSDLSAAGLDYLLVLKKHWKVSLQAIIYRAESLGVFTTEYALYLRQQISRKKWRLSEPLDDEIPLESPILLKQAIKLLIDKAMMQPSEIIFKTGIKATELEVMCSLEQGILYESMIMENIIPFTRVK